MRGEKALVRPFFSDPAEIAEVPEPNETSGEDGEFSLLRTMIFSKDPALRYHEDSLIRA